MLAISSPPCRYSRSRRAFKPFVDDFVARSGDRKVIEPLMGVQPTFLDAALDAMHDEYGSVESCCSDGLGLDAGMVLRSAFLEDGQDRPAGATYR